MDISTVSNLLEGFWAEFEERNISFKYKIQFLIETITWTSFHIAFLPTAVSNEDNYTPWIL